MQIKCPWCGPRPLNEFTYGGDAGKSRPVASASTDGVADADLSGWMNYVYLRDNPAGNHKEYWQHVSGCRSWLMVTRDTLSHEIESVSLATKTSRQSTDRGSTGGRSTSRGSTQ